MGGGMWEKVGVGSGVGWVSGGGKSWVKMGGGG